VLGAAGAYFYVWREISQPEVQLAYRLAKYLDGAVNDNQRSLILAKPIPEAAKQRYLERVRQSDGEEAMRKAQIEIQGLELGEVIIRGCWLYSHLGRDRLLASPTACAEWVAVWSDYPSAVSELAGRQPVQVLRCGPMSVTILERECTGK